jgi:ABC-2 type transport system ATP-binding protein
MPEIECENLTKDYGGVRAVDALHLKVEPGEIFGFLGPNGAGKTTTIRLLMGMLVPTAGAARIHGLDCHADRVAVKRRVGYLPDTPSFHDYLRGEEILRFVGQMHGLPREELRQRVPGLLVQWSLDDVAAEFAANYSAGMKRKLALACAQIHRPDVFILDEPTNGLDPIAAREVQNWILASAQAGRTLFLSTHLLDMAEKLCRRVGIIHRGRLLAVGTPAELKDRLCPGGSLEEVFLAVTRNAAAEPPPTPGTPAPETSG